MSPESKPDSILKKIVLHKQQEVETLAEQQPLETLCNTMKALPNTRDFLGALRTKIKCKTPAVIAEIKKASPSKGVICHHFEPSTIAAGYANAGACCLSVLTDKAFFQGDDRYLQDVRTCVDLPLLRKDFIIDEYQIYQSRCLGADCILLIAAILTDAQLTRFYAIAQQCQLAVLIEVHTLAELMRVLPLKPALIGINNRDLNTFKTSLETTLALAKHIDTDCLIISESGIHTPDDIKMLKSHGIYGFLIGESLMKTPDPGAALSALLTSL